jgi:hypothetical protein
VASHHLENRVRQICVSLPRVTERVSHGAPGFFVGRQFLMLWPTGHHKSAFAQLWCAAPPGAQAHLVRTAPDVFFRPPYVGGRGWVGRRLEEPVDWGEIEMLCEDAYRTVAPPAAVRLLSTDPGTR